MFSKGTNILYASDTTVYTSIYINASSRVPNTCKWFEFLCCFRRWIVANRQTSTTAWTRMAFTCPLSVLLIIWLCSVILLCKMDSELLSPFVFIPARRNWSLAAVMCFSINAYSNPTIGLQIGNKIKVTVFN